MRCPVLEVSTILLGANQRFNKERFQLGESLQSARCSPFVIFKVLAARMTKLITACARKNKRTARMLTNARKDHLIPLVLVERRGGGCGFGTSPPLPHWPIFHLTPTRSGNIFSPHSS